MEYISKRSNNYSKSFAPESEFSRGRRPPNDYSVGGGESPRNRNFRTQRGSNNFSGIPSRGMQQQRSSYAFRKNRNFEDMMPPPGGSFAAFTKNLPDYPASMSSGGDFSMSMGSNSYKHGDGRPFSHYSSSSNKDIKSVNVHPIVSPSEVVPINNAKGGFGRGRRGPPALSSKLPVESASNVLPSTVETKSEKSSESKIIDETEKQHVVEANKVQDKPSDTIANTEADTDKNTSVAVYGSSPSVERFEKTMEIGNYKILITVPYAPFDAVVHKKWSEVGLPTDIENRLKAMGIFVPQPIHALVIPMCATGKDVIFQSVIDGGKLTTIVLSIIAGLGDSAVGKSPAKDSNFNSGVIRPRAIIVAPTTCSTTNTYERCCRVVGNLNFSVVTASLLKDGGDCDILCTNLDELKEMKQGEPNQKFKIVFDKLRVFAVEQTERMEENFLNLLRFVRSTEGFPKDNRQIIITGTTISKKVYELALFILKSDYYFVQLKREAFENLRRYSKSEMIQIRHTCTAATAEKKKLAEQVIEAKQPKAVLPSIVKTKLDKPSELKAIDKTEKRPSVKATDSQQMQDKPSDVITKTELNSEKMLSYTMETKLEKSIDSEIVEKAVKKLANDQQIQDKPSDVVDKTYIEKDFTIRLETAIGDIFKVISDINKQLKDLSDRLGQLENYGPASS